MPKYRQNIRQAGKGQLPRRTLDYLADGAAKGNRNDSVFAAAGQFRDCGYSVDEALARIWPRAEADGLTRAETEKAVHSAYTLGPRPVAWGTATNAPASAPNGAAPSAGSLPGPIPDGMRKLVEILFRPGEYVSLSETFSDNGVEHPGPGQTLNYATLLEQITKGKITQDSYFRINPMKAGGKTDAEVTSFRHCLAEFDLDENGHRIPLETQYEALVRSGLPIATVVFSGDKSLHALVRVDARTQAEFNERCAVIWKILEAYSLDPQNKNPSRYSRLPGIARGSAMQELLAVNLGPADWAEWAQQQSATSFPEIVSGDVIQSLHLPLPPEIISGILSLGEKGELAGGSKSFKTWALIHQALAIAAGLEWWGFLTPENNVLFLNLEIPRPFFDARVRTVAAALGIMIPKNFHVWHLRRGKLSDPDRWQQFLKVLKDKCAAIPHPFITSDPIYKLLAGRNENDAGDVSILLELLDDLIEAIDGANFFGHHFSKGNQSSKEAIDRASGSGVFSRDPDTILTMTQHETDGAFVVDAILRNHPPIDSLVVEWQYPLFIRNPILDPAGLKAPKRKPDKYDIHMLAYWLGTNRLATGELFKLLREETGISSSRFHELLKDAELKGLIKRDPNNPKLWIKK